MASITNIASGDLITNSRGDINNNFDNLNTDKIETSTLDTDTTLAADSDSKIATQKAVKAYVDAGGNPNATETSKGIVELATTAEIVAGTDTGSTGASLSVVPSEMNTQIDAKIASAGGSKKVDIDTTEVTLTNTDTETELFSTTISANDLSTNNAVKFKAWVSDCDINVSDSITFRLKYGATTVCSATTGTSGISTATNYKGMVEGYLVADGTTGAQKGSLIFEFAKNGEDAQRVGGRQTGSATEDSTGDLTLSITAEWNDASANNSITAEFWVVELIA